MGTDEYTTSITTHVAPLGRGRRGNGAREILSVSKQFVLEILFAAMFLIFFVLSHARGCLVPHTVITKYFTRK